MTTSELIDLAEYCAQTYCEVCKQYKVNCWGTFDLIEKLRNRLEKAYIALKEQGYCSTCKYSNICSGDGDADTGCNGSDKWEWAGDEE